MFRIQGLALKQNEKLMKIRFLFLFPFPYKLGKSELFGSSLESPKLTTI